VVDDLIERGWFKEGIDVAKFAMALAIKIGVKPGKVEGAETVWNVGSFDPDSELKTLIPILYPESETPYRLVEYFFNKGLEQIAQELENNEYLELTDLMALTT
jgi:hypothetical protein